MNLPLLQVFARNKFPAPSPQGNTVVFMLLLHKTSSLFVPVNGSAVNTVEFPAELQQHFHSLPLLSASSSRGLRISNWIYEDHKPRRIILHVQGWTQQGLTRSLRTCLYVGVRVRWVFVCASVHACGFRHVAVCSKGSWPFLRQLL